MSEIAAWFHRQFDERARADVAFTGAGALPSAYAVTDFAAGAVAAAAGAVRRLVAALGGGDRAVEVDRRLASRWFAWTLRPEGWSLPPPWDPVAGDYATQDGWIKLHTNAPHHRDAALRVLGVEADRDAVAQAAARWPSGALEAAVVDAGGCAAEMHTADAWAEHEQGCAVACEPVLHREVTQHAKAVRRLETPERPLSGVRVLDLTRVLAGPVATRLLAGLGADVVRLDPPGWDEPGVVPEVTLGKRCFRLDARAGEGAARIRELLRTADILVHGYRPGALAGLGLDERDRDSIAPGIVDVSLSAYGWTGPWRDRRGFDSLVQMSSGIAHRGMCLAAADRPVPLPVQALDHATGYLLAMAAIDGWTDRVLHGRGTRARASLARTAAVLAAGPLGDPHASGLVSHDTDDPPDLPDLEATTWGPARRLRPPFAVEGVTVRWDRPASALGSATGPARWSL